MMARKIQLWICRDIIGRRKNQGHLVTWDGMDAGLLERFVVIEYEDFFGDLCKLKQMGIVSNYQTQFERLLAPADTLTDKQEAECFISGLKDGLRADVRVQNPQNLSAAIGLARTYELKALRRTTNPTFSSSDRNSNNQWNTSTPSGAKGTNPERILPIRKLKLLHMTSSGIFFRRLANLRRRRCSAVFPGHLKDDDERSIQMVEIRKNLTQTRAFFFLFLFISHFLLWLR